MFHKPINDNMPNVMLCKVTVPLANYSILKAMLLLTRMSACVHVCVLTMLTILTFAE